MFCVQKKFISSLTLLFPVIIIAFIMQTSCQRSARTFFMEGVSRDLAQYRARQIYDVHYELHFNIPSQKELPVTGLAKIFFKPLKARHGVILDFTPGEEFVHRLTVNGQQSEYNIMSGHIYIDADHLVPRQENVIEIAFTASDQALNRSEDFMYSLFVPDRASTAFPSFDQPDIKSTFSLSLTVPDSWEALSNGRQKKSELHEDGKTIHFASDQPISTYLFAFTAGEFEVLAREKNGREIRMLHRETDAEKLQRNADDIFNLHFDALDWLEDYTDITYPYEKFDIALLPGFQYSGMEHPGAVWYRDTRLLLDKNPPLATQIRKASLIAHETAHMWFGNLVTMEWFDDVWLKEVFAGFMADKIIEEQFPGQNHDLQFVLSHYPRAMSIDRSKGTHPIKQPLENMKMAGTLYGPIIYNKAPIVFRQLEKIMHPHGLQAAVREYLAVFGHANADWDDLVAIFDKHSDVNISQWSDIWIYGKGLPHIRYHTDNESTNQHTIEMVEPYDGNNFPAQYLGVYSIAGQKQMEKQLWFNVSPFTFTPEHATEPHQLTLLNGLGYGYGFFEWQQRDIHYIVDNLERFEREILRAAIYINMYENFLNHKTEPEIFFQYLQKAIALEKHQLLQKYLLDNLRVWALSFPSYAICADYQNDVEELLWKQTLQADSGAAEMFFELWTELARSSESAEKMRMIYKEEVSMGNLTLNPALRSQLAMEATIRNPENKDLLAQELERTDNPDRKRRIEFIMPALSHNNATRDAFFESLTQPENRRPEPWVIEALHFLHHPMHQGQGIDYIPQSLRLLEEIQQTGDIFFPQNWLHATLKNYHSPEVGVMVNEYLMETQDLPENLRLKVLQASDLISRSAAINPGSH